MILCCCPNPSIDTRVHLDTFNIGAVNRAHAAEAFPGGKGVHVALAARELGEDVTLLGIWGGAAGTFIRQACEARGIRCLGPRIDQENRRCLSFSENDTELLMPGPCIQQPCIDDFFRLLEQEARAAAVISISGSWPQGAASNAYAQCVHVLNEINKPYLIDCSGQQLSAALKAKPYAVHCNAAEIQELCAHTHVREHIGYLNKYCQISVLTHGSDGLYIAQNNDVVHSVCPLDQVISSVGCGDAVCAAIAVSLANQSALTEMATLASACGAANCLNVELGMIRKHDVDQLIANAQTHTRKQELSYALP